PRPYILYSLKPHTHEDIPFRWFQLFVDCDEPSTVDRILEEFLAHADNPDYREDLLALIELLAQSQDPADEDKILQIMKTEGKPEGVESLLEQFLRNARTQTRKPTSDIPEPWKTLDQLYLANKKYLAVARLFDSGRKTEAGIKLDQLLKEEPHYPFA